MEKYYIIQRLLSFKSFIVYVLKLKAFLLRREINDRTLYLKRNGQDLD